MMDDRTNATLLTGDPRSPEAAPFLAEVCRRTGGGAWITGGTTEAPPAGSRPLVIFLMPRPGTDAEEMIDHWLDEVPVGGALAGMGFETHPGLAEALKRRFPIIQQEGDGWAVFFPELLRDRNIHQIWLGDRKMPEWFPGYQESWKRHFPDWNYRLWTEDDLAGLLPHMISTVAFDERLNVGIRSDILRLELLRQFGGLYVDVDFECIRPFSRVLYQGCFSYGDEARHRPGNALLAAPRGHGFTGFFLTAIARYLESKDLKQPLGFSVQNISGPDAMHRALQAWVWHWAPDEIIHDLKGEAMGERYRDITVLRTPFFYPYWFEGESRRRWEEAKRRGDTGHLYPQAHAAHHWGGTWQ